MRPTSRERKIALSSAVSSIQLDAALKLLYLHKRKRLLPPSLQRLLRRIDRLYRNIWNNIQLDTRTLPAYVDEVGIVEVKDTNDRQGNDSNNEPDNSENFVTCCHRKPCCFLLRGCVDDMTASPIRHSVIWMR